MTLTDAVLIVLSLVRTVLQHTQQVLLRSKSYSYSYRR